MPEVSVIIPVYNVEKYLEKCLNSVCNQTLEDIEIIIVNDASPDNSFKIIEKFATKDKRIKVINFNENKGVAIARNTAIDIAKGEYIGFVDSDDYLSLDFYEKLYKKAKIHNADIVKGGVQAYKDGLIYLPHEEINQKIKENKFYFNMFYGSAIYSANLLKKYNIKFLENCIWGEERPFIIKAVYFSNKVYVVDNVHYCNVLRKDSTTKEINLEKLTSSLYSTSSIFEFINQTDILFNDYKIVSYAFLNDIIDVLCRTIKLDKFDISAEIKCAGLIFSNLKYSDIFDEYLQEQYLNLKQNLPRKILALQLKYYQSRLIKKLRDSHSEKIKRIPC